MVKCDEIYFFRTYQCSATIFRWSGKHYNLAVKNILSDVNTNDYENRSIFDGLI